MIKPKPRYLFWGLIFSFCFSCSDKGAFPVPGEEDYFILADSAFSSRKFMVVILTSSGCSVCHAMLEEWNRNKFTPAFFQDCLWFQAELSDSAQVFFPQLLNTISTPAILVISPDQEIRYAHQGFLKSSDLKNILQRIQGNEQILPEWQGIFYTASGNRFYQLLTELLQAKTILYQNPQDTLCWKQALDKVERSMHIEPYFMNRYLAWKLYSCLGNKEKAEKIKEKIIKTLTAHDRLIYFDLLTQLFPEEREGSETLPSVFQTRYDFGVISSAEPEFIISYKNMNSSPLIIKDIQYGCTCMQATWEQSPLLTGQQGEIRIKYKKTKKEKVIKKIYVYTNLSERPFELEIKCELI